MTRKISNCNHHGQVYFSGCRSLRTTRLFPTQDSVRKLLYVAPRNISPNGRCLCQTGPAFSTSLLSVLMTAYNFDLLRFVLAALLTLPSSPRYFPYLLF